MFKNQNCDSITERLAPITIGKFMFEQSFILEKSDFFYLT